MKVLITGAEGFLGQNLGNYLSGEGCEIYSLSTKVSSGSRHFFLRNALDKESINDAIFKTQPDYLFHLAGSVTSTNIINSFAVNTFYASFILDALDKAELSSHTKVMMIGSSAEYGLVSEGQLPISEDIPPKPFNLYGKSKLAQTQISLFWQNLRKPLVVVRPFNIIGPDSPNHLVVGNFLQQIDSISDKGILKTGNLNTARDFIDVDDAVCLMWKIINNNRSYGEIVNLCRNKAVKIIDIVEYMLINSGKQIELITEEARQRDNDMQAHYGDNTKLLSLIGDYSFADWATTLEKTIKNHET